MYLHLNIFQIIELFDIYFPVICSHLQQNKKKDFKEQLSYKEKMI